MKRLANPEATPAAVLVAELPAAPEPRKTLPADLGPPPTPLSTLAAIIISIAILDPVWATFKPMEDR